MCPFDRLYNKVETQVELDHQRANVVTVACFVGFQGYDWQNVFRVKTPAGNVIELDCNGLWDKMSPELLDFVNQYQFGNANIIPWSTDPIHKSNIPATMLIELGNLADIAHGGKA